MAKTTFTQGTVVSPEFLNAINNPIFDGADFDGHYDKIADNSLSDAAGQIKQEWRGFRDALKVSAGTGLSISYSAGSLSLANGLVIAIVPGTLEIQNGQNFIFVSESGVITRNTNLPVRGIPLALVTAAAGAINSINDLRPRFEIRPRYDTIPAFGSNGYEGDLNIVSSQPMSGTKYVRNFTLASNATLTVSGFLQIIASGTVDIGGNVVISPSIPGGREIFGVIHANSFLPPVPGLGYGGSGGINASAPPIYPYSFSNSANPGSGGASGLVLSNGSGSSPTIISSKGGSGGGVFVVEAAREITIGGSISCVGGNAAIATIVSADANTIIQLPGGGGGSGGLIWLKSLSRITVSPAASLNVGGGNGAPGVRWNYLSSVGGGGGGGGGYVILQSPANNTTGATINLAGGTGGISAGNTGAGVSASAGGSFGGLGGAASINAGNGFNGASGQLILNNFVPI